MAESSSHETSEHGTDRQSSRSKNSGSFFDDEWLAASTIRIGLALIGVILLLFALGAATGVDLLGVAVDVLSSEVGRWLVVAAIALLIIAVAAWGFDTSDD